MGMVRTGSGPSSGRCVASWLLFTAFLTAAGSRAEDTDFLRPAKASGGLRVLALGGAFVGLADDAGTIPANPAGLIAVPRSFEIIVAPNGWGSGGGRPRHAALALHPSPWVAAGAGWQQDVRQSLVPTAASERFDGEGAMAFVGAAFSFPDRRFSGGATVEWRRLSYSGDDVSGDDSDWSWSAGLLFRPENREVPRLGVRYSARSEWALGDARLVRMPSVLSTGISWHYGVLRLSDLLVSFQTDWVHYADLTRDSTQGRQARNDLDVRLGLELSFPFECFTGCGSMFQIRGGIHNAAPLPFDVRARTPAEDLGQGPPRSNRWAVGAALSLRSVLQGRLKAELTYDRSSRSLGVGFGWRFPEAYRAEIEDLTRR